MIGVRMRFGTDSNADTSDYTLLLQRILDRSNYAVR